MANANVCSYIIDIRNGFKRCQILYNDGQLYYYVYYCIAILMCENIDFIIIIAIYEVPNYSYISNLPQT